MSIAGQKVSLEAEDVEVEHRPAESGNMPTFRLSGFYA
jgi:hypothetical protein